MRYLTHLPADTGRNLGSAFMPIPARPAVTWYSRGQVYGQPGTQGILAPPPAGVPQSVSGLANTGTSRSSDAPNLIYPALYFENAPPLEKEHAPVSRVSDNQMPVPAGRPANVTVMNPMRARIGGQRQIYQPQVVQTWRGLRGSVNG
jgi:hypothetical protein